MIAYLMRTLRIPRRLAHDVVKRLRPAVNPNIGFAGCLEEFERYIGLDTHAPMSSFAETLAKHDIASPITDNSDEEPGSPLIPNSPQTAPAFQSLGFS